MRHFITKALLLMSFSFAMVACGDNNDPEFSGSKSLEAITDLPNADVDANGRSFFLTIKTDGEWKIETSDTWCSFARTSGKGDATVVGIIRENTTTNERAAKIVVVYGDQKKEISIKQSKGNGTSVDPDPEKPDPEKPDPTKPSGYAGRIEIPMLKGGEMNLFYTHTVNYNGSQAINYSAEYDCTKKHTRWVAFFFDNVNNQDNTKRSDAWAQDPNILPQYQTYSSDYKSPYNRGHLVASADRYLTREANQQTFYYSNMSPQIVSFNGGIWNTMEEKVRGWAKGLSASDTLYVVKGGKIDGTVEDGTLIEYTGNHVAVPRYYFMALLSLRNGQYKAMAFYINQKDYKTSDLSSYAISIDALEQNTGIDFFHNLPNSVESAVESNYNRSLWF